MSFFPEYFFQVNLASEPQNWLHFMSELYLVGMGWD